MEGLGFCCGHVRLTCSFLLSNGRGGLSELNAEHGSTRCQGLEKMVKAVCGWVGVCVCVCVCVEILGERCQVRLMLLLTRGLGTAGPGVNE